MSRPVVMPPWSLVPALVAGLVGLSGCSLLFEESATRKDASTSADSAPSVDANIASDGNIAADAPMADATPEPDANCQPITLGGGPVNAMTNMEFCKIEGVGSTLRFTQPNDVGNCNELVGSITVPGASFTVTVNPQAGMIGLCKVEVSGTEIKFFTRDPDNSSCTESASTITVTGVSLTGTTTPGIQREICSATTLDNSISFWARTTEPNNNCDVAAGSLSFFATGCAL